MISHRFKSKGDGFRAAKHLYVCKNVFCGEVHKEKQAKCNRCGTDTQHFASAKEAKRYAQLALLQQVGAISELVSHPRYPIVIEGQKVTVYTADFSYRRGDLVIVEDVKGSAEYQDSASKLRRKLAEAAYQITVTLV